eukprot:SAG31_NODE_1309_length_8877_cov_5.662452_1_plen_208_part_00
MNIIFLSHLSACYIKRSPSELVARFSATANAMEQVLNTFEMPTPARSKQRASTCTVAQCSVCLRLFDQVFDNIYVPALTGRKEWRGAVKRSTIHIHPMRALQISCNGEVTFATGGKKRSTWSKIPWQSISRLALRTWQSSHQSEAWITATRTSSFDVNLDCFGQIASTLQVPKLTGRIERSNLVRTRPSIIISFKPCKEMLHPAGLD